MIGFFYVDLFLPDLVLEATFDLTMSNLNIFEKIQCFEKNNPQSGITATHKMTTDETTIQTAKDVHWRIPCQS